MNFKDMMAIENWLKNNIVKLHNVDYEIDDNGLINVKNSMIKFKYSMFKLYQLKELPEFINFGRIENVKFDASDCGFESMRGFPKECFDTDFLCSNNNLTSLDYAPKIIHGGKCDFSNNQLKTLNGTLKEIYCEEINFDYNYIKKFNKKMMIHNEWLTEEDIKRFNYKPLTQYSNLPSLLFYFDLTYNNIESFKNLNIDLRGFENEKINKCVVLYINSNDIDYKQISVEAEKFMKMLFEKNKGNLKESDIRIIVN